MRTGNPQPSQPSRRTFLKRIVAIPAALRTGQGLARSVLEEAVPPKPASDAKKFVAIQVGAVSLVDEGVDQVLDIFQERGGVNALMLSVFSYGRGIAGRQVPGQPLPDHGVQQYDTNTRRCG